MVNAIKNKSPKLAFFLTWLLPGLGHFYLKEIKKGLIFLIILFGFFFAGLYLKGGLSVNDEEIWFIAAIFRFCIFCNGLIFVVFKILGIGVPMIPHTYYEIGQNLIFLSGLMNILVMLNAHDLAKQSILLKNKEK